MAQGGINDTVILFTLCSIFIILGTILPFLQRDLNSETISLNNASALVTSTPQQDTNPVTQAFSWYSVPISIAKMFFWTFGDLPIWLDSLFLILRITLYVVIYRLIRNGGG